jgi:hypothetical protein
LQHNHQSGGIHNPEWIKKSVTIVNSLAMSEQNTSNLFVACGLGGAIYARTAKIKKRSKTLHRAAANAN